jgi:phosphate transport system permease protein
MALPYHLRYINTGTRNACKIQYGTALVLIIFVLGMNIVASLIRSRARAKRQW